MSDQPWSETLREQAAQCARLAERQTERARQFREVAERTKHLPDGRAYRGDHAERAEAFAYRMRTMRTLLLQQADAYDAMIAAGGKDNKEAYEAFLDVCERTNAMLPTDLDNPTLGG